MRLGVGVVAVLAALAAVGAAAAPTPTYTVTFQGAGSEHQVDLKQNIQDDGTCDAAEHVDVTAAVSWSVSWARVRVASRSALGASRQQARLGIVGCAGSSRGSDDTRSCSAGSEVEAFLMQLCVG